MNTRNTFKYTHVNMYVQSVYNIRKIISHSEITKKKLYVRFDHCVPMLFFNILFFGFCILSNRNINILMSTVKDTYVFALLSVIVINYN